MDVFMIVYWGDDASSSPLHARRPGSATCLCGLTVPLGTSWLTMRGPAVGDPWDRQAAAADLAAGGRPCSGCLHALANR